MSSAIRDLELFLEKWPDAIHIVKVINGYDVDCTYEELVALNIAISTDEASMAIAIRAVEQLEKDLKAGNPEVQAWLNAHGFVSDRSQQMQKEMDGILARVTSEEFLTREERQAMVDRLLDIQDEALLQAQRHANAIGNGLFGMGRAIDE